VLAQVGMFSGMARSFTATIDRSPADIMVLAPKAENLFGGSSSGVPRRIVPLVHMHPEVVRVIDLDSGWGQFQNNRQEAANRGKPKRENVTLMSVDPYPGSVTPADRLSRKVRLALLEPLTVAIDQSALKKLGVKLGDKATINGQTVKVGAVLTTYPSVMDTSVVVSRDTLRLLGQASTGDRVGALMIQVRDPAQAERVRDELNKIGDGRFRAWTRAELSKANEAEVMGEQIIGIFLGFSVFLGVAIGIAITSQTLRGAILASIKEFASLRALGVSMNSLRRIIVELSFWVGMAGLVATGFLVGGVALLAKSMGVPMAFGVDNVVMVCILLLAISIVSGLMALGILKKSQPADLLR
jgi:putative ABC transport system permease protein